MLRSRWPGGWGRGSADAYNTRAAEGCIEIDDRELSWEEFGKLVVTYAGWGMRIAFVPEDEVHRLPRVEVREPKD